MPPVARAVLLQYELADFVPLGTTLLTLRTPVCARVCDPIKYRDRLFGDAALKSERYSSAKKALRVSRVTHHRSEISTWRTLKPVSIG